jgi:hypothetical protein
VRDAEGFFAKAHNVELPDVESPEAFAEAGRESFEWWLISRTRLGSAFFDLPIRFGNHCVEPPGVGVLAHLAVPFVVIKGIHPKPEVLEVHVRQLADDIL